MDLIYKIPHLTHNATPRVKRIREGSYSHHGPQLFNAMPKDLRNLRDCSLAIFKAHLDKFLQRVDDKPLVCGYTAELQTETNCLIHMIPTCIMLNRGQIHSTGEYQFFYGESSPETFKK